MAKPQLRSSAELLVEVYLALPAAEQVLDRLAIPPLVAGRSPHELKEPIRIAISDVVPDAPNADSQQAKQQRYSNAYYAVIPAVYEAAVQAAASMLDQQFLQLRNLLEKRLSRPDVAKRLHELAVKVQRRIGGYAPSEKDTQNARATLRRNEQTMTPSHGPDHSKAARNDPEFDETEKMFLRSRMASGFAAERPPAGRSRDVKDPVGDEVVKLWRILSLHPDSIEIMKAYAESPEKGAAYVRPMVIDAMNETKKFADKLRNEPHHLWRYPALVTAGVKRLGLNTVDGFDEYMEALQPVLATDSLVEALFVLGWVLFIVTFIVTWPLGVTAAGATAAFALADLAVDLPVAVMTYLEEREQDWAATGSDFDPSHRIASKPTYGRTGLATAAVLLSGVAFASSGVKFLRTLRRARPRTPPGPPGSAGRTRRMKEPKQLPPRGTGYRMRLNEHTRGAKRGPHQAERAVRDPDPARSAAVGAPQDPPRSPVNPRPWLQRPKEQAPAAVASGAKPPPHPPRAPGSPTRFDDEELAKDYLKETGKTQEGTRGLDETGVASRGLRAPYHYHHLMVQELREWFEACGVNIDRWTVKLSIDEHVFIHLQRRWNDLWKKYRREQIAKGNPYPSPKELIAQMHKFKRQEGMKGLRIVPYPKKL